MVAERVHDTPFVDGDDDDDMPPLVDNPYPSMTFTFATNMTPITYSTDPAGLENMSETVVPSPYMISSELSSAGAETRPANQKKKDANYIPRPPNAFILFRSSFIKAQHIPEKIEGNHSALSKIIGKYWKSLPRQEREVWDTKAAVALAEHRRKYPDWRFRPGTNSLSKVKDGPRRRHNKKGRGEAEKEVKSRAKRCDKIADLLVAGKTGIDLEAAIQAYDCESGCGPKVDDEYGCGVLIMKVENTPGLSDQNNQCGGRATPNVTAAIVCNTAPEESAVSLRRVQTDSSGQYLERDARFGTPLTAMFKRSSSAPATAVRASSAASCPSPSPQVFARRDSFGGIPSNGYSDSLLAFSHISSEKPDARVEHDVGVITNEANTRSEDVNNLSPLQSPSLSFVSTPEYDASSVSSQWIETYIPAETECYTPPLPAFVPDMDSPAPSPPAFPLEFTADGEHSVMTNLDDSHATAGFDGAIYVPSYSSYPPLDQWACSDTYPLKCAPGGYSTISSPLVVIPQSPSVYHDNIMKDAFAAASYAEYEGINIGSTYADTSCRWNDMIHTQGAGIVSPGLQEPIWY